MQNQSSSTPEKPATPTPLPSLTESIVSILFNPATPADLYNAVGDAVDDLFQQGGIDHAKRPDLLRHKLNLLFSEIEATTGHPTIEQSQAEPPAANQGPGLADLHKTAFEMMLRSLVRTVWYVNAKADDLERALPEDAARLERTDLRGHVGDLVAATRRVAVLFGVSPNPSDHPDAESMFC